MCQNNDYHALMTDIENLLCRCRKDPTGFDYQAAMTEVIKNNPQIIEIINRTSVPKLIGSV
jgi:hypothetical protein